MTQDRSSSWGGGPQGLGSDMHGSEYGSDLGDSSSEGGMQEKAQEMASNMTTQVQEKASEYSGKLQDQADAGIDKAAQGLEQAAEQMRSRMDDKGGVQAQVGTKVADSLEKTAGYLRDHEAEQIWQDVEQFVKDHPLQAAATAAFAGFVVARMMK